jgi:hypothetical protein
MADAKQSPRLTDSGLRILKILWGRGPASVRTVHDELQQDKASLYTTTLNLMQIWLAPGLVQRFAGSLLIAMTAAIALASIIIAEPVRPVEPQPPAGLQMQTGVITGLLRTNTGLPLEGVRIVVTPQPIANELREIPELAGLTDSTGRYRLEKVPPGPYSIRTAHVTDRGMATTIQVVASLTMDAPDLVVPGGNVIGRVVDMGTGAGRRIEKLLLCCDYSKPVYLPRDQFNGPRRGTPFTAAISNDGSFVFPFIPPGNYQLATEDKSIVSVSWALAVGPAGTPGLQLQVTDGVEVQGTVLDQNGKPVSASVDLRSTPADSVFNTISPPMSTGRYPYLAQPDMMAGILIPGANPPLDGIWDRILMGARLRSATPEPDGRFVFRGVHPGNYVLEVTAGGVALPGREIQVGLAGLTNVSFQVSAIQVTGRVITPGGGPVPKLNYIRLVRSGTGSDIFYGFPDAEGRFSIPLLPGRYQVFTERLGPSVRSVSDGSRDITNTEFTLEVGRNQQIVVTLEQ